MELTIHRIIKEFITDVRIQLATTGWGSSKEVEVFSYRNKGRAQRCGSQALLG